jgi:hypothetical protein
VSVKTLLKSLNPFLLSRALFLTSLAVTYVTERRFIREGVIQDKKDKKVRLVLSLLRRLLNC